MQSFDPVLPSLAHHLALDEALLLAAEAGQVGASLRLWEWPTYAIVLGANGVRADEVHIAACARDGVPILRRASGGGTVLLGPGSLQYSLVLPYRHAAPLGHVGASYTWLLEQLQTALAPWVTVTVHGGSDACLGGKKFSGNAQQRKTHHVLHHGTLLYAFDIAQLPTYLPLPARRPEYRGDRAHRDFVQNLPLDAATLRTALMQHWHAEPSDIPAPVYDDMERLVATKYTQAEWLERR